MIVESLRWKYDVLSLLVHRRKISRDAHVQTSKRVRALGTTYIKRVLTSPSFFPTTTSFSQPVHQNKRSGSLCLFSLTSKILQRYYQFRVCFFFDQVHIYTQQNENHHNPCCVWPFDQLHIYLNILFSCQNRLHTSLGCQKAKEAFYMFVSLASKSPKNDFERLVCFLDRLHIYPNILSPTRSQSSNLLWRQIMFVSLAS